jgi:small-conductance mechanosensitive channel
MNKQLEAFLANPNVIKLGIIIIGLLLIWLIVKGVKRLLISKISDNNNHYKAMKAGSFLGYFLSIVLISIIYSDKLGGLTVAFGVAGVGIAFALQEVIASFAGWLAIMFGGFYKSGDRVQVGGIKGDVMDIGVLRTTIMEVGQWVDGDLYNGRIVLIANSFIFKEPVFNYSGDFPFLWDEIKIPIQYGSDYRLTKQILETIGQQTAGELTEKTKEKWRQLQKQYRLEAAQIEPMVSLTANDKWVEFTLRYVVDYKRRRITKNTLFTEILEQVEATKGAIKFASATFQIVDFPELKVKIDERK